MPHIHDPVHWTLCINNRVKIFIVQSYQHENKERHHENTSSLGKAGTNCLTPPSLPEGSLPLPFLALADIWQCPLATVFPTALRKFQKQTPTLEQSAKGKVKANAMCYTG